MKYKNTIISIFAIGVFIITIWSVITEKKDKTWSSEQIEGMIQSCISSSNLLSNFSDQKKAYEICSCAIDSLLVLYSYDEIWKLNKMESDSLTLTIKPIVENCMNPYLEVIMIETYMSKCIESVKRSQNPEKAKKYCECLIPYLVKKYGYLPSKDSLLKYERDKLLDCANSN